MSKKTKYVAEMGRAQCLVDKHNKSQVVIVCTDATTGEISVVSYGSDKNNKEQASRGSLLIKNILGIK